MITAEGYSKDPTIRPEGVVITFGKEMMTEQGGAKHFLTNFLQWMELHENGEYWMHKCSNLPSFEVDVIYIIVLNRLWGKVYCGGYQRPGQTSTIIGETATGEEKLINWNHIILCGPFIKAPIKRELKGYQGFRYCTKLF